MKDSQESQWPPEDIFDDLWTEEMLRILFAGLDLPIA